MTQSDVIGTLRRMKFGTVAQWNAAGVTRGYFRTLVLSGELVQIRHGVYVTRAAVAAAGRRPELGHGLRAMAAILVTSGLATASHESAARIHGLDLLNAPPEEFVTLTRPPGSPTRRGPGLRLVAASLPASDVTRHHGLPVTTAARTVIDLARTLPFIDGVVVTDSALHLGIVKKAELAAMLDRCARWRGVDRARRVVEFGNGLAESVFESCARVIFDRNGLEPPELQVHMETAEGVYRVDFYWRKYWTIAEADGLRKYEETAKAIGQLRRDQLLRETGRHVVHFTWRELFYSEALLMERLRETFAAAPPPPARRR